MLIAALQQLSCDWELRRPTAVVLKAKRFSLEIGFQLRGLLCYLYLYL